MLTLPRLTLLSVLLYVGLSAAQSTPGATLDLKDVAPVEIGQSVLLFTEAKDAAGQRLTAALTFTSSQPDVVSVTADGRLYVNRLNVKGQPVTVTVRAGEQTDSIQVTTYGLDLRGGTIRTQEGLHPLFWAAFRDAEGNTPTETINVMVTPPQNFRLPAGIENRVIEAGIYGGRPSFSYSQRLTAVSGAYQAEVTVKDRIYQKTIDIDVSRAVGPLLGFSANLTPTSVEITGALPKNATEVSASVYITGASSKFFARTLSVAELPAALLLSRPLPPGAYAAGLSFNGDLTVMQPDAVPEQVHVGSFTLSERKF